MDNIKNLVRAKYNNVNVDTNIHNNVYNVVDIEKISDAIDKPKAIAEELAKQLNAPKNVKFYIKLSYIYPTETLFECLALTKEAERDGRIKFSPAQYFYGIVKRRRKINEK